MVLRLSAAGWRCLAKSPSCLTGGGWQLFADGGCLNKSPASLAGETWTCQDRGEGLRGVGGSLPGTDAPPKSLREPNRVCLLRTAGCCCCLPLWAASAAARPPVCACRFCSPAESWGLRSWVDSVAAAAADTWSATLTDLLPSYQLEPCRDLGIQPAAASGHVKEALCWGSPPAERFSTSWTPPGLLTAMPAVPCLRASGSLCCLPPLLSWDTCKQ